jgi:membrane-associated phospholipid phosphatase
LCHDCSEKFGKNYFKNILSDAYQVTTSPLRWDKKDWIGFALFSSCGVLIYNELDDKMEEYSRKIKSHALDEFSKPIGYLGHGGFIVPFWGAFYVYGGMKNNVDYKKAALVGFESYLVSGAVVTVLKFSVHRPRPKTGKAYNTVEKQNFFSWSNLSFPSGHAASAFSAAAVVSWYYKDKPFIPVLSYTTASLVAWSRVNDMEHWPSDVFVGSAVGYFIGKKIIKLNENRHRTSIVFLPVQTKDYWGIMLIHAF